MGRNSRLTRSGLPRVWSLPATAAADNRFTSASNAEQLGYASVGLQGDEPAWAATAAPASTTDVVRHAISESADWYVILDHFVGLEHDFINLNAVGIVVWLQRLAKHFASGNLIAGENGGQKRLVSDREKPAGQSFRILNQQPLDIALRHFLAQ